MARFWFTINLEIDASRHTAKQIQESIIEILEEESTFMEKITQLQESRRLRGMTLTMTPVKEITRNLPE